MARDSPTVAMLLMILGALLLAAQPSCATREWLDGGGFQPREAPASGSGSGGSGSVYIVRLSSAPPLVEYRGGIAGYPATAKWDDGSSENDEDDEEAVPEMDLGANYVEPGAGAASSRAANHEAVDLDDTTTRSTDSIDHPWSSAFSGPNATDGTSASGDVGNGGRARHRMWLSMDQPQVAAFASLLQRQQAQVASEAGVLDVDLIYSYKHTSNGFAARLTPLQTTDSPKFLGLPGKVWPALGGQSKAGEGTVVGIIDSGIRPEHPSFSDKGMSSKLPAGWKGKCEQSSSFRCNNKVIGAKAFYVGFQQLSGKPSLKNDWLSPRDGDGHSTWCAGAAAGNPVSMQGGGQMSGMAPAARLAVYKIFWTDSEGGHYGTETDTAEAVNQAVADGVDVLSLSLGSADPNDNYFNDLTYLRANAAGVFVAFAAGDSGPPGQSQGGGYRTVDNFSPFFLSVGARCIVADPIRALLLQAVIRTAAACAFTHVAQSTPLSPNPPSTLPISRSTIAKGASLASTAATQSLNPLNAITSSNGSNSTGDSSATLTTDGGITFTAASSAPMVADFSSRGPLLLPSATARPRQPANNILKPDIIGPGVDLVAAFPSKKIGEPGTTARLSGTSMSTPHLAGLAALIIQKFPNWTPAQVMSALMTTARVTDTSNSPIKSAGSGERDATPWDMGAGHVFPLAMLDPGLTYDVREKDYQNFLAGQDANRAKKEFPGASLTPLAVRNLNLPTITLPCLQGSVQVTRTVTCVGSSVSTYSVSGKAPQGVKVTVAPRSFTLSLGQKANYTLTATVDTPSKDFKYGYLVWANDKGHSVRSPLVVQPISR
ncbi:unnamed protein product [Closterium sp. Naga37s-1]|nr:unnamed protein product [Closterium sp. Naga37s-1]